MARLTIGQKTERVLKLLMGLRKNQVASALIQHGFSDEDLAEGWRLLQQVTRRRLGVIAVVEKADPGLVAQIDAWENKWFPIAEATLKRNLPAMHAWMFLNLSQTEGAQVIISVGTFVERWDKLVEPEDKGGPEEGGDKARALLAKRGLRAEVINEVRQLLARAARVESTTDASAEKLDEEDFSQAEAELWGWYLEWSAIAQSAITNRSLLRSLGFRQSSKSQKEGSDEEGDEEDEEEGEATSGGERAEGTPPKAKGG